MGNKTLLNDKKVDTFSGIPYKDVIKPEEA